MITYKLAKTLKEAGFPSPEEPMIGHYNSWVLKHTYGNPKVYERTRNKEGQFIPCVK